MNYKYWLYRAEFNFRKYFPYAGKFPIHVDIELAAKCQLSCTMCSYGEGTFSTSMQGMMPDVLAYDIIEQAIEGGAKSIKFNFRGEPALCKKLNNYVTYAKALGLVEASINTNLTGFTKDRLDKLFKAGLDLMIISIDGVTKETYEKIRINGNFNKLTSLLNHIKWYRENSISRSPRIRIQMVEQELNAHEVPLFRKHFRPYADEVVIKRIRSSNEGARKRCPQPWQRLVVMWNGKIGACCNNWNDEAIVNNAYNTKLKDVWKTPLYANRLTDLRYNAARPAEGDSVCTKCQVGTSYK